MLMIRLLSCALIMLCSAKIGFEEAKKYTRRVKEIRDFQAALIALKGEICFCKSPLPEALIRTGEKLKTDVAKIFLKAGENLKKTSKSTKAVWEDAVFSARRNLSMKNEEIYIINAFGNLLGISDEAGQLENIELTTAKLISCEKQAIEDEQKNVKLYKSLGIVAGIFLSIIFI